jgi:hypothetical protein
LMLSGIERFDFINKDFPIDCHFYTMWPNPWDKNTTNKKLWQAYAESIWSDKFVLVECLLNIMEAEMICQANGWNLIVASAFDQRMTMDNYLEKLGDERKELVFTIPWSKFLYPQGCKSFMQLLLRFDNNEDMALGSYYEHYSSLKKSTKYITPCVHPSQEGYRIMAEEIYNFMLQKNYVQPKV